MLGHVLWKREKRASVVINARRALLALANDFCMLLVQIQRIRIAQRPFQESLGSLSAEDRR
jgi:hypothetical protein